MHFLGHNVCLITYITSKNNVRVAFILVFLQSVASRIVRNNLCSVLRTLR